ncbi:ribonuclease E inhibitor RraB [Pyxidicoccus fallax]|uniref:Ribonuclease E inhibitor RraB n=1 Tax=Pyxidicoccus fallax TaxID=394095 RepID=A0A848LCW1_9BACT|nr:ribonuclease E inhibitor RraB [Pyxidicoccus fallax]NMO16274.1 ribonuclease E inhibitor RraB [Pyxidicoccus fallax]NPC85085.1 ribonuclease E inhibitor RraB [Pyxidicoccus fallax]
MSGKAGSDSTPAVVAEALALRELLQSTANPSTPHCFQHYLYFPSRDVGTAVAQQLQARGFTVESRLGADGVNWLVLASHHLPLEPRIVEAARSSLEQLAREHGGEYDGWEAAPVTE